MELTQHQADAFARMPLTYLRREYPNHIMHLLNDDGDVLPPRVLHPVFYGCFDWHSAVHGYWLLLRCVRLYPDLPCREAIVALFEEHITAENVAQELAYFNAPFRASFERPYGYGWLLALAQELKQSALPQAQRWYQTLEPLTQDIRDRLVDYLSKLTYPIRVGTHYNTAFAWRWRWIMPARCRIARWKSLSRRRQTVSTPATRTIRHITSRAVMSIFPVRSPKRC